MRFQGKIIGAMLLWKDEDPAQAQTGTETSKKRIMLRSEDQVFIQSVADRAALAVENGWLFQDLEKALQEEQSIRRQLVQAEKHSALSRMLASVAHELNNPIQTIQNCLFLISQDIQSDEQAQEFLQMASDETRRVSKLVTQLREVYRPGQSQSEARRSIDIRQVLDEVHSLLDPHLQHQNVHWEQRDVHPIFDTIVTGVSDQIKQVMLNIALNAIEAMQPDGGVLIVSMLINGSMIGISFKDTGPGIPKEFLSKLFDPFFTTKESGTGLGLAICFDIVQRHGGEITVESEEMKGANFTVWLPLQGVHRKVLSFEN
jgi:signal transduction histidine kinase